MDRCQTPFGKRMLKKWLTQPLYQISSIVERQDAVAFLMNLPVRQVADTTRRVNRFSFVPALTFAFFLSVCCVQDTFTNKLRGDIKGLPDLERFISRIHAHGQKKSINVIMYENVGAKKLDVFLKSLDAFKKLIDVLRDLARQVNLAEANADGSTDGPGVRLKMLVTSQAAGGLLPEFDSLLKEVYALFDLQRAKTEKKILPMPGLNEEYDDACVELRNKIREAEVFLAGINKDMRAGGKITWVHKGKGQAHTHARNQRVRCSRSRFAFGVACSLTVRVVCALSSFLRVSERYQFEVTEKVSAGASIPNEWQIASSTKTAKRYVTSETQEFARQIARLELIKEAGEKDAARLVFFHFARHHAIWDRVVSIVGEVDCLASLALVSKHHRQCVRPEFVSFESNGNKAMLDLRGSVHPTLYEADNVNGLKPGAHQSFIANDVLMGVPDENPARFVLVSGPNMGE